MRNIVSANCTGKSKRKSHAYVPWQVLVHHPVARLDVDVTILGKDSLVVLVDVGLATNASFRNDVVRPQSCIPVLNMLHRVWRRGHLVLHDRGLLLLKHSNRFSNRGGSENSGAIFLRVALLETLGNSSRSVDTVLFVSWITTLSRDFDELL